MSLLQTRRASPVGSTALPSTIKLQSIFSKKCIVGAYPIDVWINLLTVVIEKSQQNSSTRNTGCIFFAVVAMILFIGGPVFQSPLFIIAAAVVLIIGIFFGLVTWRTMVIDVTYLRTFVLPLLKSLRADVAPGKSVRLWIDLRGWRRKENIVSRSDHRDMNKTKDTFYRERWMVGQARLADRSRLRWKAEHWIRSRETTRRRVSGKTKTKTKQKFRTIFEVRLGAPNRRYPVVLPEGSQVPAKLTIQPRERYTIIRVCYKGPTQSGPETGSKTSTLTFLKMIGTAYQQIKPS